MTATRIDPDILKPTADVGHAALPPDFYDVAIAAINEHADEIDNRNLANTIFPSQFGDVGTSNDYATMAAWVAAGIAAGGKKTLQLDDNVTYTLSRAVAIEGVAGLRMYGSNSVIVFPSDDTSISQTDNEHSASQLRSAFYLRNVSNVRIRGVQCRGTGTNIVTNVGAAFSLRRATDVHLIDCVHRNGGSLILQDNTDSTNGTGDSLAVSVSTGIVTLTDAGAAFHGGMVNLDIQLAGCTNLPNNGRFRIVSVSSATVLTYYNSAAVNETSSFRYSVADGDRGTRIINCSGIDSRSYCSVGLDDTKVIGGNFERPVDTADVCGLGDAFTKVSNTITLTDQAGRFKPFHHGKFVTIAGASTGGNNGSFQLTYISATQISWTNASGAAELFTGSWWIANGEKVGTGAGTAALSKQQVTTSIQVIASSGTFRRTVGSWLSDGFVQGGVIVTTGFSNGGNNTTKIIQSITATDIVATNNTGLVNETATATAWTSLMLLNAASSTFSATDVGCGLRTMNATTLANNGCFTLEQYLTPTQVAIHNINGVAEDFSGQFTLDSYDNTTDSSSNTNGSTHGWYVFANRRNVTFLGVTFRGIRTSALKESGTNGAIRDVAVIGCKFYECANATIFGADDSNEHTGFLFSDCYMEDCATQRPGWGQGGSAIGILGSRNVNIVRPRFHYTHDAIGSVDGNGTANNQIISGSRYVDGISQPIEDLIIDSPHATVDQAACTVNSASKIAATMIAATDVGQCNKWGIGASLSFNAGTNEVTLTDTSAKFVASQDLGKSVNIVNAPTAGNNGTFTVTAVTANTLKWTNASGHTEGATYRLKAFRNDGVCIIRNPINEHAATVTVVTTTCVAPEIVGGAHVGIQGAVRFNGDVMPRYHDSIAYSPSTLQALIEINSGTSWPTIYNTPIANQAMGVSSGRDQGVGVGNTTRVDYPLLGKLVRCLPTSAQEEVVVAYGAKHVDGDSITVAGTLLTYKQTSPGAGQFNSFSIDDGSHVSLITRVNAISGITSGDYGTGMAGGDVVTQHLRIRKTAQTTSDGTFQVTVNALNPTALVLLRNDNSPNTACKSRGAGSAGPTPDKIVAWSPCCTWGGAVVTVADNADARTILGAGSVATGSIQCVAKASFVDGETVTIGDGMRTVVYEFDTNGSVTAGNIKVDISGATTAADVSAILRPLISANQPGLTVADGGSGLINLTHKWFGTGGNATITETVANVGFTVTGMSGGSTGGPALPVQNGNDAGCDQVINVGDCTGKAPQFRVAI